MSHCRPLFTNCAGVFLATALAVIPVGECAAGPAPAGSDPYLWLEDVEGGRALEWVHAQNDATAKRLTSQPEYDGLYRDALAVLNSASRIPEVAAHGAYLYNLWQDAAHPRGLYRRTTLAELRKQDPVWETVLDVDALAKDEGAPWAFGEPVWCRADERRCLIQLSRGGGDAAEAREFDLESLAFVTNGFRVPTAKSRIDWRDRDTLLIGTDFGPGTLTDSGYPRIVKQWQRGTPLRSAATLHEAPVASIWALPRHLGSGPESIDIVSEALTFWTAKVFQIEGTQRHELAVPPTGTVVNSFRGRLVIWLKEDWSFQGKTFPAGSVVIADTGALRGGAGTVDEVVVPSSHTVVQAVEVVTDGILVSSLDNVRGRLDRYLPATPGWKREAIPFADTGALQVLTTHDVTGDAWVEYQSFTTPPALYYVAAGRTSAEMLKSQAPTFDGDRFEARQFWCTSADGTRVPYFVVGPKSMKHDGTNPVWMFSYGGFENSLTPAYSGSYEDLHGAYGKLWLERGGVFVLANIRGGGEFGPDWHRGALKENHVRTFDDFEAVARDLAARGITSPGHLGIEGRSNGGLLVATTMLRHPELYGAIVCGNPLVDMQRYHRLLAGASWVAEYGNPDAPEEWAYLGRYSPYQNIRPGMKLPPIMFYTSTKDDRVHPGHARKMAAKMKAMGYDVEYFENTEGGHHGSVTSEQLATRLARTYTFLWEHVGRAARRGAPGTKQ